MQIHCKEHESNEPLKRQWTLNLTHREYNCIAALCARALFQGDQDMMIMFDICRSLSKTKKEVVDLINKTFDNRPEIPTEGNEMITMTRELMVELARLDPKFA